MVSPPVTLGFWWVLILSLVQRFHKFSLVSDEQQLLAVAVVVVAVNMKRAPYGSPMYPHEPS